MWIVSTANGDWEGERLKHIAKDIANYYREDVLPDVCGITHLGKRDANDGERYFYNPRFLGVFEEEVRGWHEHFIECDKEEIAYQKEMRSDYYARCM